MTAVSTIEPTIHILIIEDDQRLADLTCQYFARHGTITTHVTDGESGLRELTSTRFDVVLLDLMLPGENGIQICQKIRRISDLPVIMITALGEEADRVLGLESGADDYVAKPFSPREVLARVRAVVRRARGQVGPSQSVVSVDDLILDPLDRSARLGGQALDLTGYEFSLLFALAKSAGRILSRERLMELAKGSAEESFDRSVDVHISRLRHKLGDDPKDPRRIKTIRGVGYQYLRQAGRS